MKVKLLSAMLLLPALLYGQIDTEFWFAAPEVTFLHNDRPIYMYISTLDQAATITLSMPANPGFTARTHTLGANTTLKIDLTDDIDIIENRPPNTILNKGLYLESTNPVTAYYEVYAGGVNSDLFALKGTHALGNRFYTPFQTEWNNNTTTNTGGSNIDAWSSFDIVASEDNTLVTIIPGADIVGHIAGIPFNVTLHKGQTFSSRAASVVAANRPVGSLVTSTKPIAVTVKDDSMLDFSSYDLAGDQLIPVNVLGTSYIASKISFLGKDRVFILATEDGTEVFLNGSSTPIAVLNEGEQYKVVLSDPTVFIESSAPVYVWHLTGFYNELGGALLPPLRCAGSRQVSVTRSTNEEFRLIVFCESGSEGSFTVNGSIAPLTADDFSVVNGTGGVWMEANVSLNSSFAVGNTIVVRNSTGNFHLGIVNGAASTGFRYGFFSDFGFLELGSEKKFCEGVSYTLRANSYLDSYAWYKVPSPTVIGNSQELSVQDTGVYWVEASKGSCTFSDTVRVSFYPEVQGEILGNDTSACGNAGLVISTIDDFSGYAWSNGSNNASTRPKNTGHYWVDVSNSFGCKKRDSMYVTLHEVPNPKIITGESDKEKYCKDSIVELSVDAGWVSYLWSDGTTDNELITDHNQNTGIDFYWVEVENLFGCKNRDTLILDCSTVIGMIPNLITANEDALNDLFYIGYLKTGRWNLMVYNSWGQMVYKHEGYDNAWKADGIDEGVYYYLLKHRDYELEHKGWLHIMRQ